MCILVEQNVQNGKNNQNRNAFFCLRPFEESVMFCVTSEKNYFNNLIIIKQP